MLISPPRLTFFCELSSPALVDLFADNSVVENLVALSAGVSLGLVDLSPERAKVVRRLNAAGVPVIAWQLLPEDQGYWYNLSNVPSATARYSAFLAWTAEHGLAWDGIGIDVEPDVREIERASANWLASVAAILGRLFNPARLRQAAIDYAALVAVMRADGFRVDVYVMRTILDERAVGSTLFQRLKGLVDVSADRMIPMLYSSFYGERGPAMLCSYGADQQAIAIGVTGGGVAASGVDKVPALSWDELRRDVLIAQHLTGDIHVFSLEGCVHQGFLERLRAVDWSEQVTVPDAEVERVNRFRAGMRGLLWALERPAMFGAGLLVAVIVLRRLLRRL